MAHRPDDGGSKDLWNVGKLLPDYTVLQPRRQQFHTHRRENLKSYLDLIGFVGSYIETGFSQSEATELNTKLCIKYIDTETSEPIATNKVLR
jgi:hypothetical protein